MMILIELPYPPDSLEPVIIVRGKDIIGQKDNVSIAILLISGS